LRLGPQRDPVSIPRSEFWSFGLARVGKSHQSRYQFQFLGRNSGRSDEAAQFVTGFDVEFQFLGRNSGRSDVSYAGRTHRPRLGFNSSVGILVVRTYMKTTGELVFDVFQFLGRNSGRSD